ncbi:uncharacterized protein LOC116178597 isoform X1 [Photinus pyralis]|uniref:uncharacterized protein LOC116178597 isoform X1 n=1 Tax=Photinus pyralis TaxID=7054 RepID=UPI0012676324|nr:uncharacterized protein LOC116178597 isoform X1 [Photinus pyralis]XP_031354006.1 uncharacterized protein LOC116178597 isoform X1 [Photinus pyralis]
MTSQDFAQHMAMSNRIYFFNDNTEAVSKNIEHAFKETAQILNLTKSFSPHSRKRDNNCTWYDATCRNLKKEWKQTLRKFKSERTQQFVQIYLMTMRRYFSLLKQKKQAFNDRRKKKGLGVFVFNNSTLEIVEEYTYLGITFSASGVFKKACESFIEKSSRAIARVKSTLIKVKSECLETKTRLFKAIVSSVLLYGAEIWSLRYLEMVERVQVKYYKQIFHWPSNTPNYMVRMETGQIHLKIQIIKNTLNLWEKILRLPEHRLLKHSYHGLLNLDRSSHNNPTMNWVTQVKEILLEIGEHSLVNNILCVRDITLQKAKDDILEKVTNQELSRDVESAITSKYSPIYRNISSLTNMEVYMTFKLPINKVRLVSQLRISGLKEIRFYINRCSYVINTECLCTVCNLKENETLEHFLLTCPIYTVLRTQYLHRLEPPLTVESVLTVNNAQQLSDLYYYIFGALKIRAFIFNE